MTASDLKTLITAIMDGLPVEAPRVEIFWSRFLNDSFYDVVALAGEDGVEFLDWNAPWLETSAVESVLYDWEHIRAEWADYDTFNPARRNGSGFTGRTVTDRDYWSC